MQPYGHSPLSDYFAHYCIIRQNGRQAAIPVRAVRKVDNATRRINHYPGVTVVCFVHTYPLDSDLSRGVALSSIRMAEAWHRLLSLQAKILTFSNRNSTTWTWFLQAAIWRGVRPLQSTSVILQIAGSLLQRNCTMGIDPCSQAMWNAVTLSALCWIHTVPRCIRKLQSIVWNLIIACSNVI